MTPTDWIDAQNQPHLDALIAAHGERLRVRIRGEWRGDVDIAGKEMWSLDASGATIGGDIRAAGADIASGLCANYAKIRGSIYIGRSTIGCDISAAGATIGGSIIAIDAKIGGQIDAAGAYIRWGLYASAATIGGSIEAVGAKIGGTLITEPTPEQIELLDRIRARIMADPASLDMAWWHGDGWSPYVRPGDACGTAHCLAGWVQVLATDGAIRRMSAKSAMAAALPCAYHLIFAPDDLVMRYLSERQYARN